MNLLIFTQKVDAQDPVMGFFHRWLREFSGHFNKLTVVCLEAGQYDLPANVCVLSLGKEKRRSRWAYVLNFYRYIWVERWNYDAVFVHMNQEYVLLGGLFWLMAGKKVYMWRNHHAGTILTDLAAFFCYKVFCTSRYSFTAKYKKTVLMPVGIDTDFFTTRAEKTRIFRSILFLGRIAPVKKPDLLLGALTQLKKQNVEFTTSIYGDALLVDREYYENLKTTVSEAGLNEIVKFYPGIPNEKTPEVYNSHEIFVNLSSSGMYDKTIFEAMACGCLVLASNENLRGLINDQFIFKEGDREELVNKLKDILNLDDSTKNGYGMGMRGLVQDKHSLKELAERLEKEIRARS